MNCEKLSKNGKKLSNIAGFLILILAWELLAILTKSPFLPHIFSLIKQEIKILLNVKVYISLAKTLFTVLCGVLISVCLGIIIAMTMAYSKIALEMITPILEFLRHIPTIALFPVFMALFGISDFARITLITMNSLPAVILSSYHGIVGVDPSVIEAGKSDGASEAKVLFYMKLPLAISEILNGVRISIGNAFVAVVVAEMLGANDGLGFMIMWATNAFDYPSVYAYISILSVLGILINKGFSLVIEKIEGVVYA